MTAGWVLVDSSVLPEVFGRVLEAQEHLREGRAATAAEAARMAGISRSAYYKYKDAVQSFHASQPEQLLTVHLLLRDKPGVLSAVLSTFAEHGANILTVNQNIPTDGRASVSVSARTERLSVPPETFLQMLRELSGVEKITRTELGTTV
ncbi:MAG: ACT domain-containing protein [Clostridia bacterium]|nr:ACT domain-containing protein [Clostridia bacterium]